MAFLYLFVVMLEQKNIKTSKNLQVLVIVRLNKKNIMVSKKLAKVIEQPHIPKNMLRGDLAGCYKIKLLKAGVRLVYQVKDDQVVILLITVGKRADSIVYDEAKKRIKY